MFVSMLTTMVGFLGLRLATHPGLNSIGVLALIGLVTCFVAAVIVLPAILQALEDRDLADRDGEEAEGFADSPTAAIAE